MSDKYDFIVGDAPGETSSVTLPSDKSRVFSNGLVGLETDEGPDMVGDVLAFLTKFGQPVAERPRALDWDYAKFRQLLHAEEGREWVTNATGLQFELGTQTLDQDKVAHHLEECLDACVDAVYVFLGTALGMFPEDRVREAWRRVQAANMAKVRSESGQTSGRGSRHDVVKPLGWVAPTHADLVADHEYKEK